MANQACNGDVRHQLRVGCVEFIHHQRRRCMLCLLQNGLIRGSERCNTIACGQHRVLHANAEHIGELLRHQDEEGIEPHQRKPRKALRCGQINLRPCTAILRLRKRCGLLDTGDHKREFVLEAGIRLGHVTLLATTRLCPIVAEGAEHPFYIRALLHRHARVGVAGRAPGCALGIKDWQHHGMTTPADFRGGGTGIVFRRDAERLLHRNDFGIFEGAVHLIRLVEVKIPSKRVAKRLLGVDLHVVADRARHPITGQSRVGRIALLFAGDRLVGDGMQHVTHK
jgi:hypothetical protein